MEIQKWQTKSIYALAGSLGMVERGSHEDALHVMVSGMTGAESVTQMDSDAANDVLAELRARMQLTRQAAPPAQQGQPSASKPAANKGKDYHLTPTGPTKEQIDKIWALMYELRKYDNPPSPASLGARVAGIIKARFGITAGKKEPFRFITRQQGHYLIETLKGYVETAQRHAKEKAEMEGASEK
ncbi:MAG: regulatory protein GemA [Ruthenibacterium sp.]